MKKIALFLLPLITFSLSFTTIEARQTPENSKNYIVVLKDNVNVDQTTDQMASSHKFAKGEVYSKVVRGYSAQLTGGQLSNIRKDSRVKFVSEDREVSIDAHRLATTALQILPTGVNRVDAELNANEGSGVAVAVIDTGIQLSHPDLFANIIANKTCVRRTSSGNDDNGHGTHVAGTIAAQDNTVGVVGVASQAKLIAVKVLDRNGNGTWSSVICGLDWVANNASTYNIKVVNMSLGGNGLSDNNCGLTNSDALHQAICRVRDAGVTIVAAAGNSAINAANFVPAAYDDSVITVSALADSDGVAGGTGVATSYGADDTFASFSNYGSVVDIAAPGVSIYSTWKGSKYSTLSGTSMATPHVAAATALYLKTNPSSTWIQVRDALVTAGESLAEGHSDPSGLHSEPVLRANNI